MDVSTPPANIGVVDKAPSVTSQQPTVAKKSKIVVSSIKFDASICLRGVKHNPMSSTWALKTGEFDNDVNTLLRVLRAWRDGSYFDKDSLIERRATYEFSDVKIEWRFVGDDDDDNTEFSQPNPWLHSKTTTDIEMGMMDRTGVYPESREIETEDGIQPFYSRLDYLISELKNLV